MNDRMPPLPDAELDLRQRQAKDAIINGPRGKIEGPFIPLLRSPELMNRIANVGEYLRFNGSLPARIRELAIMITAATCHQQTEWAIHHPIAVAAGIKPESLAAIAGNQPPANLVPEEQATLRFVSELLTTKKISDETYALAESHFTEQAIIELATIAGYYTTLAFILNTAQTPPPPGERLP
jgi:4-carboxymuconolactone decarboxylase